METPLSPSRHANAETAPSIDAVPSPTKRPRLLLEEDDDFYADLPASTLSRPALLQPSLLMNDAQGSAMAEAGTTDSGRDALTAAHLDDAPPLSLLSLGGAELAAEMQERERDEGMELLIRAGSPRHPGARLRLEEDESFGMEEDEMVEHVPEAGPSAPRPVGERDYTSRYSNLANVSLARRVELTPITARMFDGSEVTFRRRKLPDNYEQTPMAKRDTALALAELARSMLATPYHRMVAEIEEEAKQKKKNAEADASNAVLLQELDQKPVVVDSMLWTDRYRPTKFVDLLGDERVHRSALLWLKEWDRCVFGEKVSAAAEIKRQRRKKRAREGKFGAKAADEKDEEGQPTDPLGRPVDRVLLLSGPPGLGKTTLAHVLAQQAGYQIHEVNASDDRSAAVVDQRIRNVLQSMSISKKSDKPTCLIIDEIDGSQAGEGFVTKLVKLIHEGAVDKVTKIKNKPERRPLVRPIICICNNLYASVLKPLRPIARIVRFAPPTNLMLASRLRTICVEEGMPVDSKNLTLLTEAAEGDLRSCLNTLQFIKRNNTPVTADSIRSVLIGKDMGKSSISTVNSLFKKPPRKKGGGESEEKWVDRIEKIVSACSEWDRIAQGCFSNYLTARQCSDDLERASQTLEWLVFYEKLDSCIRSDHDYAFYPYLTWSFVPMYKLFSSNTAKPLEFPPTQWEMHLQGQAYREVADALLKSLPLSMSGVFDKPGIVMELLPYLNRIISPDLKPINSQLIKGEERLVLLKVVNQMLGLDLSYVQEKNEEGQLTYRIEPPIDVFVHFDGKRAADIPASRFAVRHLVSQELHSEAIRRTKVADGGATTATDIIAAYKLQPNVVAGKAAVKAATDFFGRAIVIKPQTAEEIAAPQPPRKIQNAVYRFHEGFSNAVRVTKKVADFL